jgi:hypothetical protein
VYRLEVRSEDKLNASGGERRLDSMGSSRIAVPLGAAFACAIAVLSLVPRGIEAQSLLQIQDDPVALSDHQLKRAFTSERVAREMDAALEAGDADLATSFLDLARDRGVALDAALVARVNMANSTVAVATRTVSNFGRGFISGEMGDFAGLAGTALSDVLVIGDIRDAVREGSRFAGGEQADELILGLACVGLAITAGTYASLGASAPARVGVSAVKAARKTGQISTHMAEWLNRSVHDIVDWAAVKRVSLGASLTEPAATFRAARQVVRTDKADDLVRLAGDIGQVQAKAGARAAVEGLKIAQGPREVSRIATLAEAKGTRTRAILKTLGRGAIVLSASAMSLFSWVFAAIMSLFGFCAAVKRGTERATERYIAYRKKCAERARARFAAMTVRA